MHLPFLESDEGRSLELVVALKGSLIAEPVAAAAVAAAVLPSRYDSTVVPVNAVSSDSASFSSTPSCVDTTYRIKFQRQLM